MATATETVAGAPASRTYGYDDTGELTSATGGESYAYDGDGNRTSGGASYDAADRLTALGGTDYAYDADGFLHRRGADTFTYAPSGDLLSATAGGTTVTYAYDALGRRTARTQGGVTEQYLYGNPGNPFQLTASRKGGVLTSYYYDDEGALVAYARGATRWYVAADQVGTPKVIADSTGALVATMAYDAFGVPRAAGTTGTDDLPIGFAGGLADPVTGLVRLGLRDYDPAEGRFTARDPSLFSGSPFNLYTYGGSDPVGRTDPSGLFCASFSFYAAVGGGISFCHKDGKNSVCAEGGVGAGGGLTVDPFGDAASTSTTLHSEISESFGPLGATVGGDLDLDCFNTKGSASVGTAYGGLNVGIDTDGTVSGFGSGLHSGDINGVGSRNVGKNETGTRDSKWGVGTPSGKVALVGCGQF